MQESFKERRKYPRASLSIPLRYKELNGKTYLAKGTLSKDVSAGGVRFHSDKFIALACHLVVEMNFPSITKPIKAISKIAWIKKARFGDNYELGNHFLAMTNEDEATITKFMEEAATQTI